jgi:hypothetical protein
VPDLIAQGGQESQDDGKKVHECLSIKQI